MSLKIGKVGKVMDEFQEGALHSGRMSSYKVGDWYST